MDIPYLCVGGNGICYARACCLPRAAGSRHEVACHRRRIEHERLSHGDATEVLDERASAHASAAADVIARGNEARGR